MKCAMCSRDLSIFDLNRIISYKRDMYGRKTKLIHYMCEWCLGRDNPKASITQNNGCCDENGREI